MTDRLQTLLTERRTFPPPPGFKRIARVRSKTVYRDGCRNRQRFWAQQARELEWAKPWNKVLEWKPPHAKWFVGGKLNASVNCLDRHVRTAKRNKVALLWEGELGDRRTITYWELYREVNRFANALKGLGVRRGDRVAIYLPMIPEAVVAMLACARIGAPHSVVFGGFSAHALRDRINDAKAKVLVTADIGYRRGQQVLLKRNAEEALTETPSIQHVVVVRREHGSDLAVHMEPGRDHWYHDLTADASAHCKPAVLDANTCCTSSTRQAPQANRKASSTPPAGT